MPVNLLQPWIPSSYPCMPPFLIAPRLSWLEIYWLYCLTLVPSFCFSCRTEPLFELLFRVSCHSSRRAAAGTPHTNGVYSPGVRSRQQQNSRLPAPWHQTAGGRGASPPGRDPAYSAPAGSGTGGRSGLPGQGQSLSTPKTTTTKPKARS